jgi:hypothetical protein
MKVLGSNIWPGIKPKIAEVIAALARVLPMPCTLFPHPCEQ